MAYVYVAMENLPTELRQDILKYLDLGDVKSIRLVSRIWGRLGSDYLIKPVFQTLPHRNDFTRFLELSRHSVLESYVEQIIFNMGEMNDYQARHNIYFLNYTRDSEIKRKLLEDAWKDYAVLDTRKTMFARECCDPIILSEAFKNFSKIKSLEIRFLECPFQNKLLQRLWNVPGTQQAHRNIESERLSHILIASQSLRLETFVHDRLSLEFFRQDLDSLMSQFSGLSGLRHLRLDLTHRAVEVREFQEMLGKLSRCLQSLKYIHTFHLGFKRRPSHSRIMSPYIVECTWQHLHTLHLSGVTVSHVDLIAYIKRHASTLRNFRLGVSNPRTVHQYSSLIEYHGIQINGTPGRDFLILLNKNLKLDKFELRGTFHFKYATEFQAHGELDPTGEEDWNFEESTDMRSSLENFVVNGGDWPECLPKSH